MLTKLPGATIAPFSVTIEEGSGLNILKIFVFITGETAACLFSLGTKMYFLPQVLVGYICWYKLSELPTAVDVDPTTAQPVEILPLPQKTAIFLQPPVPEAIDFMVLPVKSLADNT